MIKKNLKNWDGCFTWSWTRQCKRILSCNNGMEWYKSKTKPLAFVGKGVCFDTGGYIS